MTDPRERLRALEPLLLDDALGAAVRSAICAPPDRAAQIVWAVSQRRPRIAPILGQGRPAPGGPHAPEVVLGASPHEVATSLGWAASRAEAAAFLASGLADPREWLARDVAARWRKDLVQRPVAIVAWVAARWAQDEEALTRPRRAMVAGALVTSCAMERLDELAEADLGPGVTNTMKRAEARAQAEYERVLSAHPGELAPVPPWWPSDAETIALGDGTAQVLRTGADLIVEGRQLQHCVASYAPRVASGHVSIIRITAASGARSTLALVDGRETEHRSRQNGIPDAACATVATALVATIAKYRKRR